MFIIYIHIYLFVYLFVIDKEKEKRRSQLFGLADVTEETVFLRTIYYKVPFKNALPLIARRDVYLEYGYAFVPFTKVVSLIIQRFRMTLSKALAEVLLLLIYVYIYIYIYIFVCPVTKYVHHSIFDPILCMYVYMCVCMYTLL